MTKPESDQDMGASEDSLLEEGWGDLGGDGGFASEHTTIDPSLLDRLAALDSQKAAAKDKAKKNKVPDAEGLKAPERRERTINLDISDLLAMEEEEEAKAQAEAAPAPAPAAAAPAPAPVVSGQDALLSGQGAGPSVGSSRIKALEASNPAQPSIQLDDGVVADDPGAFSEEKTQIFVPAMDDEPTRAKLRVVQGGGQQKEYLLARDRVTIGRGTNNDILVPDIAMSRQHCEIKRQADGIFKLNDLNSGNGTRLNGTRVLDADLFGGDRIEIGNTILEFVITGPGASRPPGQRRLNVHPSEAGAAPARRSTMANPAVVAAPAAPPVTNYSNSPPGHNATATHFQLQQAPAPTNTRSSGLILTALIATFGLLFLSLTVVIGAKIYLDFQNDARPDGAQVSNKPASAYFTEGSEHVKARDWSKAEEKFTIAADLAREERDFQIRKDAELQLERVRVEQSNQQALERGRRLVEKKEYPEAIAKLSSVRTGSVYDEEAQKLLKDTRGKHADALVVQGNKQFEAKNYDEADKKVAQALSTLPDHAGAKALRQKINDLPDESYTRPTAFADNDPRAPRPAGTRPKAKNGGGGGGGSKPPAAVATGRPNNKPPAGNGGGVAKKDPPSAGNGGGGGGGNTGVADFAPGLSMYRGKRYREAINYFNNIANTFDGFSKRQATELAGKVASFEKSYKSGSAAYSAGQWSKATSELGIAYRLDKSISRTGYHSAELRQKLAEGHFQVAQSAFNSQNFALAGRSAKKVKGYNPSHVGNQQLLSKLESKGRSMYIDALNRKESDPNQARRIAKAIVDMLPASSDTHKKAKQLMAEL